VCGGCEKKKKKMKTIEEKMILASLHVIQLGWGAVRYWLIWTHHQRSFSIPKKISSKMILFSI